MSKKLKVLIVEDSEDDALLLLRELRQSGYETVSKRVETPETMKAALRNGGWDIVISDYVLPRFSGLVALDILKQRDQDIPFIIVSGNIGEDIAVDAMRAGAQDYIIKGNLTRLVPAVERELREAEVRRKNKQAEAEAIRAGQLASLGELAAGVAHEINNPINGIVNYAQMLLNKCPDESKEHEIAGRILKESNRIATIVKNLLSFARERREMKKPVRIHEIMSETLFLTEAQLRKDSIKLKVNIPPDLPEITAHSQQIQQVFLNIISNARYALNHKYRGAHDNKTMEIFGGKATIDNNPYVRITFYDRGTGIPSAILDKVLNPFFSTKPDEKGTGLGLSISHGIINDHGGRIKIESVEGEFTRVIIDLPAAG